MKTFIKIITMLIVLNLAMGSFAPAECAADEDTVASVDEGLVVIAKPPSAEPAARTTGEADIAKGSYNYIYTPYNKSSFTKQQPSDAGAVLVIPSVEMKAEELSAIMEDLNVMSRILDKKLGWLIPAAEQLGEVYFHRMLSRNDKRVTEAIYLGGFGAMFLTSVNFPLSPPPELKEEKKDEEDVDSVWSQTKREIYSPEDARGYTQWTDIGKIRRRQQVQVPEYDAEKAEELKRTLTKTLKHAANIRVLKGDEWVTIVVKGSAPAAVARITNARLLEDGKIITRVSKKNSGSSSPTFLTIRAKKSDIDEFAKNELDDAEFHKKTQIITY